MSTHNNLEIRYRRLLRFYPKEYRAARGEEIVGTYLESAPPERTRPGIADVGDIAKAGLRQRFRYVPEGLPGGLRLAAVVALSLATATALCYTLGPELAEPNFHPGRSYGPFNSPAVALWALWMAVGVAAAFLPGRITRLVLSLPVLATLAAMPLAYGTNPSSVDPALLASLLAPQLALGVVALAWPSHPGRFARFAPMLSMPVGLVVMVASTFVQPYTGDYENVVEPGARLLLVVLAVIMVRLVVAHRGRGEGGFAAAVLAFPGAVLAIGPVLGLVAYATASHPDYFGVTDVAATVAACAIVGLAVPAASYAVAARRGLIRR